MKSREERIVMELFAEHCQKEAMKKRKHNPLTNMIHKTADMISEPIKEEDTRLHNHVTPNLDWLHDVAKVYFVLMFYFICLIILILSL